MTSEELALSEQLREVHKKISEIQYQANTKGYTMDLESIQIAIEGHINTCEYYENQPKGQ